MTQARYMLLGLQAESSARPMTLIAKVVCGGVEFGTSFIASRVYLEPFSHAYPDPSEAGGPAGITAERSSSNASAGLKRVRDASTSRPGMAAVRIAKIASVVPPQSSV